MRVSYQQSHAHARWLAGLAGLLLSGSAVSGQSVTLKAMLIQASNDPAPLDRRMDRVEFKLRKIFNFEHYRFLGENDVTIGIPSEATLDLSHGNSLKIDVSKGKKDGVRAEVHWLKNDQSVLRTAVVLKEGSPAILGGPRDEKGTLIVVLELQ